MAKLNYDKMEIGFRRTDDGGLYCESCGADLTPPDATKFILHADGKGSYKNVFECTKCGAMLTQEFKRKGANASWWGD